MGGKRGYKKGKKGTPEVLASQQLECRDSLGRVVQQVQCQGRGKCDEKARGGSGQEKLGRVLSRERRRRRGRKVLFSCVTFCASEIMGDHCPIRQSRGPKGTPARPGSSSSSLLHSLFSPSLLPTSSSCRSTATSRRPLRSLPAAPFAHTHLSLCPLSTPHRCSPASTDVLFLYSPQPFFASPHHCLPSSAPPSHPLLLARNHWTPPPAARPFRRSCRCPLPVPALHAHIITAFVRPPHAFTHSRKAGKKKGVEILLLHQ